MKLQNVEEVVAILRERLSNRLESSYFGLQKPLTKFFWHVQVGDMDRVSPLYCCDPIKGTMKIHSIYSMNRNNLIQLFVKDLAYVFVNFVWIIIRLNVLMSMDRLVVGKIVTTKQDTQFL